MTMKREGLRVKYFVYIGSIDLVRRYNNTCNTVRPKYRSMCLKICLLEITFEQYFDVALIYLNAIDMDIKMYPYRQYFMICNICIIHALKTAAQLYPYTYYIITYFMFLTIS